MIRLFITIFGIAMICVSCGKKTTVAGRVYNPVTGEGVENIDVVLSRTNASLSSSGGGTTELERLTTDATGNYSFEYRDGGRVKRLRFVFDDDFYYPVNTFELPLNGKQSHDLQLVPTGGFQRNFENVNCFDSNDVLLVSNRTHRSLPDYYNGNMPATYNGCFQFQTSIANVPMGWHVWTGTITRNGITEPWADSIYVQPGELNVWNIHY
jgi:hypothetical protein